MGWLFWQGTAAVLFFVAGVAAPLSLPVDHAVSEWWPAVWFGLVGVLYLLLSEWIRERMWGGAQGFRPQAPTPSAAALCRRSYPQDVTERPQRRTVGACPADDGLKGV